MSREHSKGAFRWCNREGTYTLGRHTCKGRETTIPDALPVLSLIFLWYHLFTRYVQHPPQSSHVGDGRRAGLHAGWWHWSALAVDRWVVLERWGHRRVSFWKAPEMSSQRAAGGHMLWCAHLLRELQHRVLLLGEKRALYVQITHGQ